MYIVCTPLNGVATFQHCDVHMAMHRVMHALCELKKVNYSQRVLFIESGKEIEEVEGHWVERTNNGSPQDDSFYGIDTCYNSAYA